MFSNEIFHLTTLTFVSLQPHKGLWALKSPIKIKGLGSWSISSSSLLLSMNILGGKYMEQVVIALFKEILTAVACYYIYY